MLAGAMKTKRFVLGVFSCFLLALGMARAAGRLDPMSINLEPVVGTSIGLPTPDCTNPCLPCDDGTGNYS